MKRKRKPTHPMNAQRAVDLFEAEQRLGSHLPQVLLRRVSHVSAATVTSRNARPRARTAASGRRRAEHH